jgi:hypothetical protein
LVDTYKFAKASGDRVFLEYVMSRLVVKYQEDPNTDFVLCLQGFARGINEVVRKADAYDALLARPFFECPECGGDLAGDGHKLTCTQRNTNG